MAYASITKPSLHFNTKLYTGTGSSNALTGIGFQPDLVWLKGRSNATWNWLTDSVRGNTKNIFSNSTQAEGTNADGITAFGTDGFTLGTNTDVNGSGNTFVSWNWKANAGTTSSNTDGSITSTVQANTTAGFSIVKYTGTGSNATVGHGLGAVPGMIIFKCTNDAQNWRVYHRGMDATAPEDYALILNNTNARDNDNTAFNDTAPTTTTFGLGTTATINQNGNIHIAYCFAEKKGYSKFGSYIGNGNADGTFVYTGFKPSFIMLKNTIDVGDNWTIYDSKRDVDNQAEKLLFANSNSTESTGNNMDILSNGFKQRNTSNGNNGSGDTFIYAAFAEEPLVANVGSSIPATAR